MGQKVSRFVRLALSMTLALYLCMPSKAVAATVDLQATMLSGSYDDADGEKASVHLVEFTRQFASSVEDLINAAGERIVMQMSDWNYTQADAQTEVELNAQWGDLDKPYTITEGGTYYLSADLTTKSSLVVDAADEDVVIKLNGYVLTLDGSGAATQKTMLSITAAKSVRLDGASAEGASSIKSAGELDVWAVSSTAESCALSANDLTIELKSKSAQQRYLSTHVVRVASGTLNMKNCTLNMLMGNQSLSSADLVNGIIEVPSAVYATADAEAVTLDNCTVVGEGTQGFSCNLNDVDGLGNAYAVHSLAAKTTVAGGVYKAVSVRGNATCIYGTALEIVPGAEGEPIKLEADAGQIASGILSTREGGVKVNAPLDFAPGNIYVAYAQAEAAFRSLGENGFVFGGCAPENTAATYSVLVMHEEDDLLSANSEDYVIGALGGLQDARADSLFVNALGSGCSVRAQQGAVRFVFDERSSAAAEVETVLGEKTRYPTLAGALRAFPRENGSTLRLLRDAGDLVISGAVENAMMTEGTVDLNRHAVTSLEVESVADGVGILVKNGRVNGTKLIGGSLVGVYQNAKAPLTLTDVAVTVQGADASVYGVYADNEMGTVTLNGTTSIDAVASRTSLNASVYGIGMSSSNEGAPLVLDGITIKASTASAGVAAYGISCTAGLSLKDSNIVVRGTTAATGAIYGGGELLVDSANLDVYATGSSPSSNGFGIWGRTVDPQATDVFVNSSSIQVRSAGDVSGRPYACLMGSTTNLGSSSTSWTLSGENKFVSSSGLHMGLNLAGVTFVDDFALSRESDAKLGVSQEKRVGDTAFKTKGAFAKEKLESLANRFYATVGSYYEGWMLIPDTENACLAWSHGENGSNAVALVRGGIEQKTYSTLAEAIKEAQSGDEIRLNCSISEGGTYSIDVDNLTLNLNDKHLTVRAGGMTMETDSAFVGLAFTGQGKLDVRNGNLTIEMGLPSEVSKASSIPYEGIAVAGGGALTIASDAVVNVDYIGSTSDSATQRDVVLHGVAVRNGGKLELAGKLDVSGSIKDASMGAMATYGVYSLSNASPAVSVTAEAQVDVQVGTAARTIKNAYYAETTSAITNDGPTGLRELVVDPATDAGLYEAILTLFRESATYDDPDDVTNRNALNLGFYYLQNAQLSVQADENGDKPWYDGLRIWAYSDVTPRADVGKLDSIVPTHIFTSSEYDTLPEAYGIATGADVPGSSWIYVEGKVSASCLNGNATALNAQGGAWECDGAELTARADDHLHLVAASQFDLRDYISFSPEQSERVVFSGAKAAQVVKFQPAKARDMVIGDGVAFYLEGEMALLARAGDAASIEASLFTVDDADFRLKTTAGFDSVCTVANNEGKNKEGALFAYLEDDEQADLFEDAYCAYEPAYSDEDMGAVWGHAVNRVITFKVGDAVVARYADQASIDLAEPTAAAKRMNDQRQAYELVGWSLGKDENATSGYLGTTQTITPKESTEYYAVYSTGMLQGLPVTFTNIHGSSGALQDDVIVAASYGQAVGDALDSAGVQLPAPADYEDAAAGLTYRFVGWHPYTAASSSSAIVYGADQVSSLKVTLSVNGVSTTGLTLRAVYLAVQTGKQHIVSFKVDGYTSACIVDDGARPVYTQANKTNTNYVFPAKIETETGKGFTFSKWFVDDDENGVCDEGEVSYASVLPAALGDVTYVADWTWEWSDVTLTFYVKYVDKETQKLVTNGVRVIEVTYEDETQDVADKIVKVGDAFGYGGKTYTFKGWSSRKTDTEAVYDGSNPLPSVNGDDRALSSAYAKTYYGVYAIADHKVDVLFFDSDGTTLIGQARQQVAVSTTVDGAFSSTGAKVPADKSESESFLGWAARTDDANALNGTSTVLESLVDYADTTLSLYAVYGELPIYTVNLRNGNKVSYQIYVKRGKTVASALSASNTTIDITPDQGKYLAGWYTAGGEYFSLNTPITGSANLYAKFSDVDVSSDNKSDATFSVALNRTLFSTMGLSEELAGVSLSVVPRSTSDTLLRSSDSGTAKYGYTILKSYTMKLIATYKSGTKVVKEGSIGSISVTTPLKSKYKNAKPRFFWLGLKDGSETVSHSAVKTISSEGTITAQISNYEVGDEDEGGNLCVAYVEGGSSEGSVSGSDTVIDGPGSVPKSSSSSSSQSSKSSSSSSVAGVSGSDSGSGGSNSTSASASATPSNTTAATTSASSGDTSAVTTTATTSASATPASSTATSATTTATTPVTAAGSVTASSATASGLPSAASAGASGATASATAATAATAGASSLSATASAASVKSASSSADGAPNADSTEGATDESEASFADEWDSNAVVLIVLAVLALAGIAYGLWKLIVVRPKRDEEEAEYPSMEDRYANGVTF